jgi:UDP-N-acetylglucosamine 2-epimerase (non-hydrolysing)
MKKFMLVAGARPNFVKIAPIIAALRAFNAANTPFFEIVLVHTGQHYDRNMSDSFFSDLEIPVPDVFLGVGSGSHSEQTARIMIAFEKVCLEHRPDAVIVVGDVNSTVACGLVAAKLLIPLIHVEAGLRSCDRTMPEEINRVVVDSISDYLFVTEQSGVDNLMREGRPASGVFLVGNVMIDTLYRSRSRAAGSPVLEKLGVRPGGYGVLTLHRPGNVDDSTILGSIIDTLMEISSALPIVFPVHPRTRAALEAAGIGPILKPPAGLSGLVATEPLGYLDFLKLMDNARLVFTDSGGIQEETTALGVPCLTLRKNTERPITITNGTNRLVGLDPDAIKSAAGDIMENCPSAPPSPLYWDGKASRRIVDKLYELFR